jgi:hypothetical protein
MQYVEEEEDGFTDDGSEEGFTDDGSDEGFTDDGSDEGFTDYDGEEGFTDDDEEEGFFSSLFEGFKSKKPNKAARAKARAKARDKRIKKRNREVRKREAKRWKKRGKEMKKGLKKVDKALGISKKYKKHVDPVMKKALTRAQMQAKIAKQQMEENNIALGNAQKHMAEMKSSIMKQVPEADAKEFKKLPSPNKSSSFVFLGFAIIATMIVFALYYMKYSAGYVADIIAGNPPPKSLFISAIIAAIILMVIIFLLVVFKGAIMKTDMNKKMVLSIASTVLTIGLPVLAITLMTIENLPLMMRTFENTFGFSWINGKPLRELSQRLFGGNGNYNDYSIITTQLFEENYKYYLTCMKKDAPIDPNINLNRFKNVFIDNSYFDENGKIKMRMPDKNKPDSKVQDLYDLLSMVVRKRHISVATWVSLGTIVTMYASYLL